MDLSKATPAKTASSNQASSSPLINLPAPIKTTIYTYVLVVKEPLDLAKKVLRTQYALLNTCNKIRKEAMPIFYGQNVFVVSNLVSESMNLVKCAEGNMTKLLIQFTIPASVRKRCKNRPGAIYTHLADRAGKLPGFLLAWGPPAEALKIIWPEKKGGQFTADQQIITMLNKAFQQGLALYSRPSVRAVSKMITKKADQIVARESKSSGKEDNVGLKANETARKVALELNGGTKDMYGDGVCTSNFMATLSLDERREVARDIAEQCDAQFAATEKAEAEREAEKKAKKKAKRERQKAKRNGGNGGGEGEGDATVE